MNKKDKVIQLLGCLPADISTVLKNCPDHMMQAITEVHIRSGQEIVCTCGNEEIPISKWNRYSKKITSEDINRIFGALCRYSIHKFQKQIANGYIALENGHRAGIAGRAVLDETGKCIGVSEITSICIRISDEHIGCGEQLYNNICPLDRGVLIAGLPGRGKTSILRDLVRILSHDYRVVVVDEKGEIGAAYNGELQNDLGPNTDVLSGYEKPFGIAIAVKNLSPQIIVCDEIGLGDDQEALEKAMISGVHCIATIHGSKESVKSNSFIKKLVFRNVVSKICFLKTKGPPGQIDTIVSAKDLYDETDRYDIGGCRRNCNWI